MGDNTLESRKAWADALLRTLLDRWLDAAPAANGLFHPDLDRQWRRLKGDTRTLVSQCRLIYNFARGYEYTGESRFAEAANRGIEALQNYFLVAPGRYRWAVWADGTEQDATLDSYGHAFCILALATAARTLDTPAYAQEALAAVTQTLTEVFTDASGGLAWRVGERFSQPRSQNPMMHMFEALMALQRVDASGCALQTAEKLLGFVSSLADFSVGALIERYDLEWIPLSPEQGGVIDLGHAFEWAYLLSDWHAITLNADWLRLGEKFLQVGLEWGLDVGGGVREACDPAGRIVVSAKGLWQQGEAIRAISRYITRHGQENLAEPLEQMQKFYQAYFIDSEYGGVFASPPGLGKAVSLDKGDAWKLDYHSINMCLELVGSNG
jgi:mannose/cellobiose epimerase-like protein (N-acyl-D-glucosamine 2-epimerase family)